MSTLIFWGSRLGISRLHSGLEEHTAACATQYPKCAQRFFDAVGRLDRQGVLNSASQGPPGLGGWDKKAI